MAKKKLITLDMLKKFMGDRISITISSKNSFIFLKREESEWIKKIFKKTNNIKIKYNNVTYIISILNQYSNLVLSISFCINPILILKEHLIKINAYDILKEKEYLLNHKSNNFIHPNCVSKNYQFNKLIIFQKALLESDLYIQKAETLLTQIIYILRQKIKSFALQSDNIFIFNTKMSILELCLDLYCENDIECEKNKITQGFRNLNYKIKDFGYYVIAYKTKNLYYKIYVKAKKLLRCEVVKLKDALTCKMIFNNAKDFYEKILLHSQARNSLYMFYLAQNA